jgi:hypothetical protein
MPVSDVILFPFHKKILGWVSNSKLNTFYGLLGYAIANPIYKRYAFLNVVLICSKEDFSYLDK